MKVARTILVAAALFAIEAHGQVIDVSSMKCQEFIELPKETANAIAMWLDGYFTDEQDPAAVDLDKLKGSAEKLGTFCTQNPKTGLITAAEDVMGK